jgi:hypothetical protein
VEEDEVRRVQIDWGLGRARDNLFTCMVCNETSISGADEAECRICTMFFICLYQLVHIAFALHYTYIDSLTP